MDAPRIIVVGLDYSPLAEAALFRALRFAEAARYATIHAVTVGQRVGNDVRLPDGTRLSQWAALEAARTHVAERVRQWPHQGPSNLRVVAHVRGGDPARALLDMAFSTGAELIALGSHSGTLEQVLRVGATAQRVLKASELPVHVESPLCATQPRRAPFDPLRFAFVFGTGRRNRRTELALRGLGALDAGDPR